MSLYRTPLAVSALTLHALHFAASVIFFYNLFFTSTNAPWPQFFPPSEGGASEEGSFGEEGLGGSLQRLSSGVGVSASSADAPPKLVLLPAGSAGAGLFGGGPNPWGSLYEGDRRQGGVWLCLLALMAPPFADAMCFLVGLLLFLGEDVRKKHLFCISVATTLPKHFLGAPRRLSPSLWPLALRAETQLFLLREKTLCSFPLRLRAVAAGYVALGPDPRVLYCVAFELLFFLVLKFLLCTLGEKTARSTAQSVNIPFLPSL